MTAVNRRNSANPVLWIDGRNYGNQFYYKGKIRSVRIYNRLLTADEMLHNQKIDNDHFNLGLNL